MIRGGGAVCGSLQIACAAGSLAFGWSRSAPGAVPAPRMGPAITSCNKGSPPAGPAAEEDDAAEPAAAPAPPSPAPDGGATALGFGKAEPIFRCPTA